LFPERVTVEREGLKLPEDPHEAGMVELRKLEARFKLTKLESEV